MIESFNNHFKKILFNFSDPPCNFVLGLSGGADSTALLYLLKIFKTNNPDLNINVYPVIIDHGLRPCSTLEAVYVKNVAIKLGFEPVIKIIHDKQPTGNIQNWARVHRRKLLHESAVHFSANLLLAHHFDDQVETIYMRLLKGSGIDGLVGIKEVNFWNGIFIVRPLLIFEKAQLKEYISKNFINYFEDPSNKSLKYERVRTRETLMMIKTNIWPKVACNLNRLSVLNKKLLELINPCFMKWIEENVLIDKRGAVKINLKNLKLLFCKSNQVSIKILGKIIQMVGGKEYSPKKKKTLNLIQAIFKINFKSKSLGNVNVYLENNFILFIRERRNLYFNMKIIKNKYYVFDGRFLLFSNVSGTLVQNTKNYFDTYDKKSIFVKYKDQINNSLPILKTLEGESVSPHLNIMKGDPFNKEIIKDGSFELYLINKLLV
jgi:tRNA(Ile)-lysidine synthase